MVLNELISWAHNNELMYNLFIFQIIDIPHSLHFLCYLFLTKIMDVEIFHIHLELLNQNKVPKIYTGIM